MRGLQAAFGFSVAAHVAVATGVYVAWPEGARWEQPAPIVADLVYEPRPSVVPAQQAPIMPLEKVLRRELPHADPARPSQATSLPKANDNTLADPPQVVAEPPIAAEPQPAQMPEPVFTVTETRRAIVSALPALPVDSGQVRPTPRFKLAVPARQPRAVAQEGNREESVRERRTNAPTDVLVVREERSDTPEKGSPPQSVAMLPDPTHERAPGAKVSAPQYALPSLGNRPPKYPLAARRRGMEGRVVIEAQVDRHGEVTTATVALSSGHRLLDRAALGAVKKWTFRPARRGSQTVRATIAIPVTFALESSTVLALE